MKRNVWKDLNWIWVHLKPLIFHICMNARLFNLLRSTGFLFLIFCVDMTRDRTQVQLHRRNFMWWKDKNACGIFLLKWKHSAWQTSLRSNSHLKTLQQHMCFTWDSVFPADQLPPDSCYSPCITFSWPVLGFLCYLALPCCKSISQL